MLREVTLNELEALLEFVIPIMSSSVTDCYPRRTVEKLKSSFERSIQHSEDQLMVCTLKGKLVGVINLQIIKKEKYIQGIGIYICEQYAVVMEELLGYLKKNYKGYEVFLGYPNDNKEAIKYFESKDIKCIESSYDMRLDTKRVIVKAQEYNPTSKKRQYSRLSMEKFEDYAPFHDHHAGKIYWNSRRIKEKFDDCFIYICEVDTKIIGSIFIKEQSAEMIEVFAMIIDNEYTGQGIEQMLLQGALQNLITQDSVYTVVVYFIEEGYDHQVVAAKEAGFKLNDHYKCFKVNL